jgi:PhzF family phenazine biosynthesis protein
VALIVHQVDAFREDPFLGNPAGVCLPAAPESDERMQAIAREMNLSETAFVTELPGGEFNLRWFTPKAEVKLCGHATLATAHVLWQQKILKPGTPARFQTLSGLLTAQQNGDEITLDFPAKPAAPAEAPPGLLDAFGFEAVFVSRSAFDYLVQVEPAATLRNLQPDFVRLAQLPVRGIIVTSPSDDSRFDFLSRFFAPAVGVDEDPVTGSAHCTLAPYWASKLGKTHFLACQVSPRGGVLRLELKGDRVLMSGKAVVTGQRQFGPV